MLKIPKRGWLLKAGILFLAAILGVFILLPGGFLFAQDVSWAGQWQGWFLSETIEYPDDPCFFELTITFIQDNSNVVGTADGDEIFRGTADGLTLTGILFEEGPFEFTMSADGLSIRGYGESQWNGYTEFNTIEATRVSDTEPAADGLTITASSGSGGSISDEGVAVVAEGASKTYSITPQGRDYEISDVVVDGMSVGAVSSYTFENVQGNHAIYVDFGIITKVDEPEAEPVAGELMVEELPYTGFDWMYAFMGLGMLLAGSGLLLLVKKLRRASA